MKNQVRTSNKKAREYVENLTPFKANNLFSCWMGKAYVVYSYGTHWPLFVRFNGYWYENGERYSVSTSKHKSQVKPQGDHFKVTCAQLKSVINEAMFKVGAM